jgi:hypothetical protein
MCNSGPRLASRTSVSPVLTGLPAQHQGGDDEKFDLFMNVRSTGTFTPARAFRLIPMPIGSSGWPVKNGTIRHWWSDAAEIIEE